MLNNQDPLNIGAWRLLPAERVLVTPKNEHILLEPKTSEVLRKLAMNPAKVVGREPLIRSVWRDVVVSDDSLYRCIYQLRQIFRNAQGGGPQILTVRGKGYRLNVEDELVLRSPSVSSKQAGEAGSGRRMNSRKAWMTSGFVGLGMVLIGLAGGTGLSNRDSNDKMIRGSEPQQLMSMVFMDRLPAGQSDPMRSLESMSIADDANSKRIIEALSVFRPGMTWNAQEISSESTKNQIPIK